MAPIADVGGWFRTVSDDAVGLRTTPWGPATGGFGLRSTPEEVASALEALDGATMVLTGAGMSTGSGLPDYRGVDAVPRAPMLVQEFLSSDLSRRRYWARSTVGWQAFSAARPGQTHLALAEFERSRPVTAIVTQNVDGLHQAAGSRNVLDLHGRLSIVACMDCDDAIDRDTFQRHLLDMNPAFAQRLPALADEARTAPDGDAEVDRTEEFRYPSCRRCRGTLKPDVVFFGENAKPSVVAAAFEALNQADSLLVLGSSLTVMSGRRFLKRTARDGKPIVIVNDGYTRGDELATARIFGRLEDVLGRWIRR